jgi:NAD(P)-dependent dehydrogenase (short-subunit alcohol dehydrogenase family)
VGAHGVAFAGDVRDASACEGAVKTAVDCFGGLQILVNNAGVGSSSYVADTTDEEWDTVLATNLTSVFRLTRAALPHLSHRGGHIILVSSLAGSNPIAGMAAYCASKAALDHFAACLMLEVRQKGVKVTTIAPGSVDTTFGSGSRPSDASWMLAPEDVAQTVVHLLKMRAGAHSSRVEMRREAEALGRSLSAAGCAGRWSHEATTPAARIPRTTSSRYRLKFGPRRLFSHECVSIFAPTRASTTASDTFR